MATQVADILEAAATVLLVPDVWTQETMARDASGEPTGYANRAACQWCTIGAIRAAASDLKLSGYASMAIHAASSGLRPPFKSVASASQTVIWWNDDYASSADEVARRLFKIAQDIRNAGS